MIAALPAVLVPIAAVLAGVAAAIVAECYSRIRRWMRS